MMPADKTPPADKTSHADKKNSADYDLDRVLTALGAAEPPSGMNARLLAVLESRAIAPLPSRWQRLTLDLPRTSRRAAIGLAAAAALTIAITPLALHRPPHRPASVPAAISQPATSLLPLSTSAPIAKASLPHPPARRPHSGAQPAPPAPPDNLHAASFPAPPLPLTRQERLLRRIAHTGDPIELAMLDPERRAEGRLLGERDFQTFFQPPSPPPQPSLVPDPPTSPAQEPQ